MFRMEIELLFYIVDKKNEVEILNFFFKVIERVKDEAGI